MVAQIGRNGVLIPVTKGGPIAIMKGGLGAKGGRWSGGLGGYATLRKSAGPSICGMYVGAAPGPSSHPESESAAIESLSAYPPRRC